MNCIDLAMKAAGGKLTDQEILDAFENEQKIRDLFIQAGQTDNLDLRVANRIAQDALAKKVEAARMKRQVAQNIKARAELDAHVKTLMGSGLSPRKAIIALWEGTQRNIKGGRVSGYAQAQAYEAKWIGSALSTIEREKPHVLRLFTDKTFDADVTRELFELREGGTPGKTGNKDAQYLARVLSAHMEMSRTELNNLGAAIGKLDGYAGPQVHDDLAMAKTSAAQWTDDILPLLDIDKSFPDAKDIPEVRKLLGRVYDTIITGVSNDKTPLMRGQRVGPANLATHLGKHRVLHFKDADAALAYRDKYGRGSTIQGIFGQMRHQSRMAGAMHSFGPNPKAMLLSLAGKLQHDLKAKIEGMEPGKKRDKLTKQMNELAASDGEVARLKATIDDVTGLASRPVGTRLADISNTIRTTQALAKLGGAVLTAIPSDTVTMASAAMFRGGGFFAGLGKSMAEIANRKNGKQIGYLLGEGFDGIIGHLGSAYADGAPGTLSRVTQNFFHWSGLSGWTDTARAASARVIAAELGMNVKRGFRDLDANLRTVLELNGINEAKWDALRSGGAPEINGRRYLTPDVARTVDEGLIENLARDKIDAARAAIKNEDKFQLKRAKIIQEARRDLELDLHRYYADETSYAVIETDAASRRLTTMGYRPGTLAGEAMRFIMQFKGFPTAFSQRVLGRSILHGRYGHLGATIAGLTVAGYMSIVMKDMFRGTWPPRDPLSGSTLLAAAMQGGALGIYGDFLFGQRSRFGMGPVETLAGPTVGSLAQVWNTWQDLRDGNPKAGSYLDIALNNTPFINLFYTRPALDYLFINSLREAARPGSLARQSKRLKEERGQHFVLPRTLF